MKAQTVTYKIEAGKFQWELAPGKVIGAWGYNNQIPGPILKARKGDTLVIKFKNNLDEPTTIHWHGLRIPSMMDGTDDVQKPVLPGETFEYRFVLPDAGTYWYHSHFNEPKQMERGLYGVIIIEDETNLKVDADRLFVIDDMKLTADHKFKQAGWFLPRFIERHDGREGETLLINGKEQPTIEINAGQTERWRFVNASSARYFLLNLGGKSFQIIGTDGGLIENPQTATELLITPGERYELLAGPFEEGESFFIESLPYNRMTSVKPKQQQFARVQVGESKASVAVIPEVLRKITPLAAQDAEVARSVKFSVGPSLKRGLDLKINDGIHAHDEPVKIGDLQVWELINASLMDHPFHLHGFFFQVIEENGAAPEYRAWKDTINLPPKSTIKIAWMPDNRPGRWMYHCHILEHHAAGMMAHFEVVDDLMNATARASEYSPHQFH
ncbi:MAG TPA: multicopper oxidase family protein [Balneolaceae bacterium]|nr:multicopper oxidase family protein [Balneolaceae bacterium]